MTVDWSRIIDRSQVYIARDAHGGVLYVGCSSNVRERIGEHRRIAPWWSESVTVEIREPLPRREALALEQDLIWTLGPLYNQPPRLHPLRTGAIPEVANSA